MDQNTVEKLHEYGAFLVLLDVPRATEFSIDWNSWTTDTKFKGLKMIPPGVHYISYRINGAPTSGFFHFFSQKEVFCRKWNSSAAIFKELDELTSTNIALPQNLKSMDSELAPYPIEDYKKWCGLSNFISRDALMRLNPFCGFVDSVCDYTPKVDENNRSKLDKDGLPILSQTPESRIQYTAVSRQWWPENCSAQERSIHAQDSSWFLGQLLAKCGGVDDLLAELQYSYIVFVIGQHMASFDHWKQLLRVFSYCTDIGAHSGLYQKFFITLYFQIQTMPEDFMVDIVSSNNVVLQCLNQLFRNVFDAKSEIPEALFTRSSKFRKYCETKFNWKLYEDGESEDDDEDGPTIVQL